MDFKKNVILTLLLHVLGFFFPPEKSSDQAFLKTVLDTKFYFRKKTPLFIAFKWNLCVLKFFSVILMVDLI